ncbi:MAG: 1,4-dihydroxy-2-naphthoate polyprenyltransferase [Polyangiaceae bacterium]|nr:1,4-dihydroxy-2-naphthoate polyprenyltransferase [Polyangiaceae bacterium]MCW5790368.1 1,4-dihydroxy-2-naphthoate polyprenyltransferase [Polyangiaceae bacterium]
MPERAASPRPNSLAAWVLACRPATLWASSVPVLVGSACAKLAGGFALWPALAALVGAGLLQVGSNFANDVFDYEQGADTEERLGPTRAVAAGLVSPRAMKRGMVLVFALALAVGVYLTFVAGPVVVAIGVASIVCAIAYTGGPYPLGYNGLGDLFVMLFFGFVAVLGTELVQVGAVSRLGVLASVPVGALATAILVVNNLRDIDTDRVAGKRTLAVRFGRRVAIGEYALLNALAYALAALIWRLFELSPWALLPLFAAPLAIRNTWHVSKQRGAPLNRVLVRTAQHLAIFGLLFALGLTLSSP